MTIDKVLCATVENNGQKNTRVDTLTGELSSGEGATGRTSFTSFAGFERSPEPAEALRNRMWQIRCEDCDPKRGGYYWFSLDQCDTPAKALDCIIQLNEKDWSPIVMQSFIELMESLFGRGAIADQ